MPVRPAALALLLVLAGCGTPGTVVPGVDLEAPTATFTLDVPEGYLVVEASAQTAVSGSDGSSSSRAYLSVVAEEVATGERVLLIYQDVHRRSSPVAIYRFRTGGGEEVAAEPPATEGWSRPAGQR